MSDQGPANTQPPDPSRQPVPAQQPIVVNVVTPSAQVPLSGLAVTSMVLGIVGLVLAFIPFINFFAVVLGLLAVVLGIIAIVQADGVKHRGRGMGVAGLVLGVITGIIVFLMLVVFAVAVNSSVNAADEASLKSDLIVAATAFEVYYTQNGSYPTSMSDAGLGFSPNAGNDIEIASVTDTSYCLDATSADAADATWHFDSAVGHVASGSRP